MDGRECAAGPSAVEYQGANRAFSGRYSRSGGGLEDVSEWQTTAFVIPMGAPRMTQRDRWKKRPVVVRYHAFKDQLRLSCKGHPADPQEVSWIAYLPFPKSYSVKRRRDLAGCPHRLKPDRDNIDKAILDALFPNDARIAEGWIKKFWDDGNGPRIEITMK